MLFLRFFSVLVDRCNSFICMYLKYSLLLCSIRTV